MNKQYYVAIMAGGIGSRFWPASRESLPKQFLDIMGNGKSLLRSTFERFLKVCPKENIYILTNESYIPLVQEQLPELKLDQILGEPARKNTAPCIAYVAQKILKMNPEGAMIVAPSDHIIRDEDEFCRISEQALNFASKRAALLTLGIVPSRPDTGYGYIQFKDEEPEKGIRKVKTFTEKPDLETAKKFLASGDFLWNAGIFIWSARSILDAFEVYLSDVHEAFESIQDELNTDKENDAIKKAFLQCPSISIDFGIMEKADNVYVMPSDFGWSDLGTWASLHAESSRDMFGNAVPSGDVVVYESNDNIIHAPKNKLVVVQGLDKFIVVDTGDVLLICSMDNEQKIKQITADLKRNKKSNYL